MPAKAAIRRLRPTASQFIAAFFVAALFVTVLLQHPAKNCAASNNPCCSASGEPV